MKLNIYSYSSPLNFLIDSYKALKLTSDASLRAWSETMGFDSPVLVMDLLKKKRPLKLKYANYLAIGLNLNEREKSYFKTLIQLEKADEENKAYFQEVLSSLRPVDASTKQEDGVYSHWLNVIIYTLSQMDDFSLSVAEIQASLKENVPLHFIEESLNVLVEQKLFEKNPAGEYKRCNSGHLSTANDVSLKSSHSYYRQIISKALAAVDMNVEEREFQCFAIGMKKENLGKVKEILRNARQEISTYWDDKGDHVYQFNLNGFPLAEIRK